MNVYIVLAISCIASAIASPLDVEYADMVEKRHELLAGHTFALPRADPWKYFREAWPCPTTRRYGTLGDGGKWTCFVRRNCTIISIGINNEYSFETEMAETHGCIIAGYDPTVDETVQMHRVMRFRKRGVRGGAHRPGDMSVREMLSENNVTRVDIFKVDVEEAEYGMLDELFADYPMETGLPFDQLLIEFHLFSRPVSDLVSAVERLEAYGFRMFETELNPDNPHCCAELAFVHKDIHAHMFRAWLLAERVTEEELQ